MMKCDMMRLGLLNLEYVEIKYNLSFSVNEEYEMLSLISLLSELNIVGCWYFIEN